MILLIDNYDSFVFNLARYVGELGFQRVVIRNDAITLQDIKNLQPDKIIISPGPCTPKEAGISMEVIKYFGKHIPILGVCLGHQAIGEVYGGTVSRAQYPLHGKATPIFHDEKNLFQSLKNPMLAARYHSLIVSEENLPDELIVTARSRENEIMGLQHRDYPVFGVQFHPESVLTEQGHQLLGNFLSI